MATDVEGTAGFSEADQRHQNVVQAKRQQQSLAGAEDHRAKIPGAVDHLPEGVDPHGEDWPHQRDSQPDQTQHHGGDDRHEAGAAEEGQGVRQANVMEAFMQQPDDNPGDNRAEDPGIDRRNTDDVLDIVGLQDRGVGGGQNAFRRQPEVDRQVHDRVADKAGEGGDAFVLPRQPQWDGDTEHDRQEAESKGADFAHPDKDGLQQRHIQPRQQRQNIVTA